MEKCAVGTYSNHSGVISTEINMDGYLNGVGVILLNCYKDFNSVKTLIGKSGKIKRLDVDLNKTEYSNGENNRFRDLKDFYSHYNGKAYKYIYFFDGVNWYFVDFSYMKDFKRLNYQDIILERDIYNKK